MKALGFWWRRWLVGWGNLADGLAVVLTLGVWCPELGLKAETAFLDWCEKTKGSTRERTGVA